MTLLELSNIQQIQVWVSICMTVVGVVVAVNQLYISNRISKSEERVKTFVSGEIEKHEGKVDKKFESLEQKIVTRDLFDAKLDSIKDIVKEIRGK